LDNDKFDKFFDALNGDCQNIRDFHSFKGSVNKPIVILVHGIGGNAEHWSNPINQSENLWLFDIDNPPSVKSNAVLSIVPSPFYAAGKFKSWCEILKESEISYVNFSQSDEMGPISRAVNELLRILNSIKSQLVAVTEGGTESKPPLILLCHSRGGLVTRYALKEYGNGDGIVNKIITLCTPHQGSYMPKLAHDYNAFVKVPSTADVRFSLTSDKKFLLDTYFTAIHKQLGDLLSKICGNAPDSDGFVELIPGSAMLQKMSQGENPLPGVEYYSFGGTNPKFVNLFLCIHNQPYKLLSVSSVEIIKLLDRCIPGLIRNYDGVEELIKGDSAVAEARSHWPPEFNGLHQTFSINHPEALINGDLQQATLKIILS
jgi:pimeloyl-ACP methyl ester carboxylesterase